VLQVGIYVQRQHQVVPFFILVIEEIHGVIKQWSFLLHPVQTLYIDYWLCTRGDEALPWSYLFSIGLHWCSHGCMHTPLWQKKRACDLIGSVSVSRRPLRHLCPLRVSIETRPGSTVGAESMTEHREDPHTK